MKICLVFLTVMVFFNPSLGQSALVFEDKTYDNDIKTVQLFPDRNGTDDSLLPAASTISPMSLVLEFDDLQGTRTNYNAAIIHCTYDWRKSTLNDLDFLREYNEFTINDYTFSSGTQLPYVHYRFPIPSVKLPGNYLIIVYRDGDKTDLVISHRFLVFANVLGFTSDNQLSGLGTLQKTSQPLNFTIDYSELDIMNPMDAVHVVIRQNQRWDNAKTDIKPSFIRDNDRQMEYHFLDQDNVFTGGNEFRWVDFRSLRFPGQNTARLDRSTKPPHLFVMTDKARSDEAYAQYIDQDGNYRVDDRDNEDDKTTANYLPVTFTFNPGMAVNDPIYVIGAFNNWQRTDENKLIFNTSNSFYESTILLKQGLYDYQYWIDSRSLAGSYLEGNHFETENLYEVLVYVHTFQPNADQLMGYFVIPVNPR